jgi:hypothetical protein
VNDVPEGPFAVYVVPETGVGPICVHGPVLDVPR